MKPARQQVEETVGRLDWVLLVLAALIPLAALALLQRFDVPLGKPHKFVYQYSPFAAQRIILVPATLFLALVTGWGTWLAAHSARASRSGGLALVTAGVVAIMIWAFWAPPAHLNQHYFNMQSPSHDGAFFEEAAVLLAKPDYLAQFPDRASTPPENMRGTRVVSNPPGTTLLAAAAIRLTREVSWVARLADWSIGDEETGSPETRAIVAETIVFGWLLVAMSVTSVAFLYPLGRQFLAPGPAMAFTVCAVVTPATLLFTPGKDPAQLLTVALPLWLWFRGYRRNSWGSAALAGGGFVLATMVSLVHIWAAAIVVAACLLHARGRPGAVRLMLTRGVLPAAAGAALVALGLFWSSGLNAFATTRAVAAAQAEVTRGADAMPFLWQTLGIPLFLLFAGPACWTTTFWLLAGRRAGSRSDTSARDAKRGAPRSRARRRVDSHAGNTTDDSHTADCTIDDARLGRYLLVMTLIVLIGTVGFTNIETPRLWIPFVPLILLGTMLQLPASRGSKPRAAKLLAALVILQISGSAVQWHWMDMREAEHRLLPGEDGRARFFG